MPNHLTKALEYARRKFETNYPDLCNLPENGQSVWLENSYIDDIKSFLSSSHLAILEAVRELAKSFDDNPCVCSPDGKCEYNKGWNKFRFFLLEELTRAKEKLQ